jgi:hypothetical protein
LRNIDGSSGCGKGKNSLIRNSVVRNINATSGTIETLVTFVQGTIAKKNTHLGTKLQLA